MINVSSKSSGLRYAKAVGELRMNSATVERLQNDNVPKGNVPATARAAGIAAAKKTSDWIVFCHPIPLDWVEITVDVTDTGLTITSEVESVWKTGVEMEAITGAMGALINAYDMLKPLDPEMEITAVKVVEKRGGKSQFTESFDKPLKSAVLVISDSTYQGTRQDKSGQIIKKMLTNHPVTVDTYEILPDDTEKIKGRIEELVKEEKYDLIITTGGTGFGPKDYTPEAVKPLLDKIAPGITEQLRRYGSDRTPYAMLSREIAGTIDNSLILSFPGSSKGAKECMDAIFPGVLHIFPMLWGGGHDTGKKRK